MFGTRDHGIELSAEEVRCGVGDDQQEFLLTLAELDCQPEPSPLDLSGFPVGAHLGVALDSLERQRLSGHELVDLLKARERQIAHLQSDSMADAVEISYAASANSNERLDEQFEFASDEIRAALTLTRRAAEYRLSFATDLVERLPRAWGLLQSGEIDLPRARVFADSTAHVDPDVAREIVDRLSDVAPKLTTGQLRYRISKLCMTVDPDDAEIRERSALEDRKLVIEPTVDGTAILHLLDLRLSDARAIGRRINAHMISLKKEDRSGRTHDQLRADIARDLLIGGDASNQGRGFVEIRVAASTLDGGDEPGELPGLGPVTADAARQIVASSPDAEHQITLVDDDGRPTHIYTLSRRATKQIRRHIATLQPYCSFPGCQAPARDCDFDHLTPWTDGGETSTTNGGPKCDHDHTLKDHGWDHRRAGDADLWTSPLGHNYMSQPP